MKDALDLRLGFLPGLLWRADGIRPGIEDLDSLGETEGRVYGAADLQCHRESIYSQLGLGRYAGPWIYREKTNEKYGFDKYGRKDCKGSSCDGTFGLIQRTQYSRYLCKAVKKKNPQLLTVGELTCAQVDVDPSASPSNRAKTFNMKISLCRSSRVERRNSVIRSGMNMPRKTTLIIRRVSEGCIAAM